MLYSKKASVPRFHIGALAGMLALVVCLGGCGSDDPDSPTGGNGGSTATYDLYVDAATGSDSNDGSQQTPFKTITHAMTVAAAGDSVKVLPGTYDASLGESFPIRITDSVSLIGDETNRGLGPIPTRINGYGPVGQTYTTAIEGGDGSTVAGFHITVDTNATGLWGIYCDSADFTMKNNRFTDIYGGIMFRGNGDLVAEGNLFSPTSTGIWEHSTGQMTITNNEFLSGNIQIHVESPGEALIRGNSFSGFFNMAIAIACVATVDSNNFTNTVFSGSAIQTQRATRIRNNLFELDSGPCIVLAWEDVSQVDIGTANDPGNNVFSGNNTTVIHHKRPETVYAIGNTWHSTTPVCGTEIVTDSGGVVIWGTNPADKCP